MRALAIVVLALAACSQRERPSPAPTPANPPPPTPDAAPISHDDYAHLLVDRLARAGITADYDRDAFELVLRSDAGAGNRLLLANVYLEYVGAAPADREGHLDQVVAIWTDPGSAPKSFLMAKARLRPLVRSGEYFDAALDEVRAHPNGKPGNEPVTRPLDDFAAIGLALDSDQSLAVVTARDLDAWHASWDDAMPIAIDNLRAASHEPFDQPAKGVFVSPWHDTYDAARLLVPDVIAKLAIKGRPVALVPNRDTLIVAGDRDAPALLAAADLAEKAYARPRQIDAIARCWDGAWRPCVPDVTPAVAERYRALRDTSIADLYAEQKERLDASTAAAGDDVFVASLIVAEDPSHARTSIAVLSKGVPTLLPRADLIGLVDPDGPKDAKPLLVRWDQAFALLGARWKAMPVSPPRWRVEVDGYPTAAELARLPQVQP